MPDDSHQTSFEHLLQLKHVSKSYGGLRAPNDVSVGIEESNSLELRRHEKEIY
jgi:ABC-type branched-subunit amino acid transport system ATPase component